MGIVSRERRYHFTCHAELEPTLLDMWCAQSSIDGDI